MTDAIVAQKRCNQCNTLKPLTEFHRAIHRGKPAYRGTCKECRKSEPKFYEYALTPERLRMCCACKRELPCTDEFFYQDKRHPDGLNAACKICRDARRGRTEKRKSPTRGLSLGQRRCTKCSAVFPSTVEYFDRDNHRPDGLLPICKKCNANKSAQWAKANPDRVRLRARKSAKKYAVQRRVSWHRYRTRKLALPCDFTNTDWQRALDYFSHSCAACGKPRGLWHTLAQDHWIPLSNPNCPGTVPANIVPLCHTKKDGTDGCNNTKGGQSPEIWLEKKFGKAKATSIMKRIKAYFSTVRKS